MTSTDDIRKYLEHGNAFMQVPVEFQTELLGLDERKLDTLKGKRCLDVGCGRDGKLVRYLREIGIYSEGIDPFAPKDEFFMRQNVCGLYPMEGSIPREDGSYGLVLAFQNGTLNRGFTIGGIIRDPNFIGGSEEDKWIHDAKMRNAQFIVYESLRVVEDDGRVVIYPECVRIEELMGPFLRMQEISTGTEDVSGDALRRYFDWELNEVRKKTGIKFTACPDEYFETFGLLRRTVLTKK